MKEKIMSQLIQKPFHFGFEIPSMMYCELIRVFLNSVEIIHKNTMGGTSLVVQWLRLHVPKAGGPGSIPGQGTRSYMHAATRSSQAATKEPACSNENPACCN